MACFRRLEIVKVDGHAGQAGNERADRLARVALKLKEKAGGEAGREDQA